MRYKQPDYFSIGKVFTFLTVYFIIIPFVFSDLDVRVILVIPVILIGLISFTIGFRTNYYFKIEDRKIGFTSRFKAFVTIIILLFLFMDLHQAFFILITPLKNNINYNSRYIVESNYGSLYFQIPSLIFLYMKFFFYAVGMSRSKALFYLIFLIQIILYSTNQVRLVFLSPFILFIIYGFYMDYLKLSIQRIFLVILFSPLIFLFLLLSRGRAKGLGYYFNIEQIEIIILDKNLPVLIKTSMESFLSFEYLVSIINDGLFYFESGIIRIFYMAIPRNIWPGKPEALSRIISKNYNVSQYDSGGSSAATIFGDFFLNGHVIGVMILMFVFGFVSKVIHATVFNNVKLNRESSSILIMFYSIFVFHYLFYFRGFFSESYWKSIILILVFVFLFRAKNLFSKSTL
jgi:hypothetical protein